MTKAKIIANVDETGRAELKIEGMTAELLSLFTLIQKQLYKNAVNMLGEEEARTLMLVANMLATEAEEEKEDAQ